MIQPKFGKIEVTAAHHLRKLNIDEIYIDLSGLDKRLSPIPALGDDFTLRLERDNQFTVEYNYGQKFPVTKPEVLPVLKQMAKGASIKEWERMLKAGRAPVPLMEHSFPKVSFDNPNGVHLFQAFPHTLASMLQRSGLDLMVEKAPLRARLAQLPQKVRNLMPR